MARVKHILVVDDDALMLAMIGRALQDYEVTLARDGDEALRLTTPGMRLDLLITDYLMPAMMGDELLGRMRERRPSLKALVISGHGGLLEREMPDWWRAQPHLEKPFTISALRDLVTRLIGPPHGSDARR
jgi:DNA-binding NtrC family response regulator